jgi:chromosomal replication initiation ATPase DnaA
MSCEATELHELTVDGRKVGAFTKEQLRQMHFTIAEILKHRVDDLDVTLIIKTVCDYFGTGFVNLMEKRRPEHIIWPRHVGMYFLRMRTNKSSMEIARVFNRNDHGTVLHAVKAVEKRCVEARYRKDVELIAQQLTALGNDLKSS